VSGVLLDTHALIWWSLDSPRLSAAARAAIIANAGAVFVSAASAYEADYKTRTARLPPVVGPLGNIILAEGFAPLPISLDHAARAASFGHPHRDPWDRVIAAQAIAEGLSVVTKDAEIGALGARVVW
jgi:PIN domain nuclease of toxin-antitoxin system